MPFGRIVWDATRAVAVGSMSARVAIATWTHRFERLWVQGPVNHTSSPANHDNVLLHRGTG